MPSRNDYFKSTNNIPPRKILVDFLNTYKPGKKRIEIGSGAGNDTNYLLQQGYTVLTIDGEEISQQYILEKIGDTYKDTFSFSKQSLENLILKHCDVVYSAYTLPFCEARFFDNMMEYITININPGGYFVGNFFGPNDDWKHLSLRSQEQIKAYFTGFDILSITNSEYDKRIAASKTSKHRHEINIVAKKKYL